MNRGQQHSRDGVRPAIDNAAAAVQAATPLSRSVADSTTGQPFVRGDAMESLTGVTLPTSANAIASGQPLVRLDRMMESLRHAEYDITSGLGELVDNSVEGGAQNTWISYRTERKTFGRKALDVVSEIAVVDDGEGMTVEVLRRCLVLGDTPRPKKANNLGIGRFGVGMTLGSISLARRVEVYSRATKDDSFAFTFLDLDLIKQGEQDRIPEPVAAEPPADLAARLAGKSGTIVILKKCDRLQHSPTNEEKGIAADEQVAGIPHFLARTYRKFIGGGVNIWFGPEGKPETKIYLHDPLFRMSPTLFEAKGKPEPKAEDLGTKTIELNVPGDPGKKAAVTITMTLLPKEWRPYQGSGGGPLAREHRIDENEGVSVLRANREVLYGPVPYIIGKKGQASFLDIDRWWGCEIAFPPELDPYFHVRYIKRGAEPVPMLRDEIRKLIAPVVETLRKKIKEDFEKTKESEAKEQGVFAAAEDAMAKVDKTLPKGKKGAYTSPEEADKTISRIAEEASDDANFTPEEKEAKKTQMRDRLTTQPYSIVPVKWPANVFFETEHLLDKIVVKLNVNHPFYKKVFEPLCGSVETMNGDGDAETGPGTPEQRRAREGFMVLLLSYAKAESFFESKESTTLLQNLRMHWGVTLGAVINELEVR